MQPYIKRGGLFAAIGILISVGTFAPQAAAQDEAAPHTEALTAKGAWSPAVTYRRDDIVTSRGSTWRARRVNQGKVPGQTQPSTTRFWEVLAAGFNPKGAWVSTKKYQRNDLVTANGSTWRARRTNRNKAPVPGPDWERFAARGAAGPNTGVSAGTQGAPGISFTADADTGIYSPQAGKIAMVENGTLFLHNSGTDNTALGLAALAANTTGASNTALGRWALGFNTSGSYNTAVGAEALDANTTGDANTAIGQFALTGNTTGGWNTAVGSLALTWNTTGTNNTAIGRAALKDNQTGQRNTAIGESALSVMNTSDNIAIGFWAGIGAIAPSDSIFIGNEGAFGDTKTIKIGTQDTQTSAYIAGIYNVTSAGGIGVFVNSNGQLGTATSSRRYKEDIVPIRDVDAVLSKLKPVVFRYKQAVANGSKPKQYGLIAEDVEEVSRDLVAYNKDGSVETVRYHFLPPLLLAGWQAQQKTIAAQAERIATLEARLAAIEARLPLKEAAMRRD
jgi:hypothetical protein